MKLTAVDSGSSPAQIHVIVSASGRSQLGRAPSSGCRPSLALLHRVRLVLERPLYNDLAVSSHLQWLAGLSPGTPCVGDGAACGFPLSLVGRGFVSLLSFLLL